MSLELTDEQKDIRRAAREFAEGEFPNVAQECDEQEKFTREVWKKACGQVGMQGKWV